MALATLSIDLVAKLASFEADMGKAARASEATATRIKSAMGVAATAVAGLVTVAAVLGAVRVFNGLIEGAAKFQDIAEKTGDTAQNMASLAVAAATAGTDMEAVASASVKLTKNLTGVDDESKAAGAALAAIGINLEEFKKLEAADRFEAIAKALGNFGEGSGKTAVAVALLGKSGAELLPFLKELGQEGARQVILTDEQIRAADDYADALAKSQAQNRLFAEGIATKMLPVLTEFKELLTGIIKDEENQAAASTVLKASLEGVLSVFRTLVVFGSAVGGMFEYLGTSIGGALAQAAAFAKFDFKGGASIGRENIADLDAILARKEKFAQSLFKPDAAQKTGPSDEERRFARQGVQARLRPRLNFDGAVKPERAGKDTAAQEAKAQLAYDLEQIKKAGAATVNTLGNTQKLVDALHAAGLVEDRDYYAKKLDLLNRNTAAQEATLTQELTRLQAEKLTGKDKIDNARKIVDVQAQLLKVQQDAATTVQVLAVQETAAIKAVAQQFRDAEDAANDFLKTLHLTQGREIAGAGIGNVARSRSAGRAQIEDKFSDQRQALAKSRRDAELNGTFGVEAQAKYDGELERIRRFQGVALAEYETFADKRAALDSDATVGKKEAFANYLSDVKNVAQQTENLFTNAFKGAEDALVSFVTTGKLDFSSLAKSIISDLARIEIKRSITGPIASALQGSSSDSSGSGLIGGIASFFGGLFGGGRASGGPVQAGKLYQVNERGPELLNLSGRQYLMMGGQGGSITPNGGTAQGGNTAQPLTVIQNFTIGDVASASMVRQAVAGSERRIAAGIARSQRYGGALA